MRDCATCEWLKWLEDSNGRIIYFCMNADSSAYLAETDICGNCDMEEDNDKKCEI